MNERRVGLRLAILASDANDIFFAAIMDGGVVRGRAQPKAETLEYGREGIL